MSAFPPKSLFPCKRMLLGRVIPIAFTQFPSASLQMCYSKIPAGSSSWRASVGQVSVLVMRSTNDEGARLLLWAFLLVELAALVA